MVHPRGTSTKVSNHTISYNPIFFPAFVPALYQSTSSASTSIVSFSVPTAASFAWSPTVAAKQLPQPHHPGGGITAWEQPHLRYLDPVACC